MNKPIKTIAVALAAIASMSVQQTEACTRATYIGPDNTVITGRTMDWKEDLMSNIYVFPRGMQRAGYNKGNTVNWTSKYGSVIAAGYDIGTCDGMNEKGLVASLLFRSPFTTARETTARLWASVSGRNTYSTILQPYAKLWMN